MPAPHRLVRVFSPAAIIGGALVIALLAIFFVYTSVRKAPARAQYTTVVRSDIVQTVQTTGTVTPTETVDLAFERPGTINRVMVKVGDRVSANETLATLSRGELAGQLQQAQASVDAEKAKLSALQVGTRPAELAADETALAQQINSAFIAADNAVHVNADQFFTNPRTNSPQISFSTSDGQLKAKVQGERFDMEGLLEEWRDTLPGQTAASSSALQSAAETSAMQLSSVEEFLNDCSTLLAQAVITNEVPLTSITGYQSSIATARTSIANALSSLNAAASQLTVDLAGSSQQDIDAQKAALAAAQGSVATLNQQLAQTIIRAPIAGTISRADANPGQVVSGGLPVISLISDARYEIDAYVSEADIGKLDPGQDASVALDAYPGRTFAAKVVAIDPAATMQGGVPSYKVTAQFTSNNSAIMAGLTANLSILTASTSDAITVPSSAIITKDSRTYVLRAGGSGTDELVPVTVGITSADGKTEIVSGLEAGDRVESFGQGY